MAIQYRRVSDGDLSRMVHDDDLSVEGAGLLGWVVLGVGADGTTADVLDGYVLHAETNVVSWDGLEQRLVVRFDGLDFSGDVLGSKGDDHAWLEDARLHASDGDSSNA